MIDGQLSRSEHWLIINLQNPLPERSKRNKTCDALIVDKLNALYSKPSFRLKFREDDLAEANASDFLSFKRSDFLCFIFYEDAVP